MHDRTFVDRATRRVSPPPATLPAAWVMLLAAAVLAAPLQAQRLPPATERQLDSLLAARVGTAGPGCAIGVGMGGSGVYLRGAGDAIIEHGISISPRTAFNLGSISKQFTAYAALHLARGAPLTGRRHPALPPRAA